jgi:hypothetical protein
MIHPLDSFRRNDSATAPRRFDGTESFDEILSQSEAAIVHLERREDLLLEHLRISPPSAIGAQTERRDHRMPNQD